MDGVFAERARVWLNSLDEGVYVLWGHDLARPITNVHTGWIDVCVPAGCRFTGMSWLCSIIDPDDLDAADADGVSTVVVPHDVSVSGKWVDHQFVPGTVKVLDTPTGQHLDGDVMVRPGWTTSVLNDALSAWADRLAGRGDLRFVFDRYIITPLVARLNASAGFGLEAPTQMPDVVSLGQPSG